MVGSRQSKRSKTKRAGPSKNARTEETEIAEKRRRGSLAVVDETKATKSEKSNGKTIKRNTKEKGKQGRKRGRPRSKPVETNPTAPITLSRRTSSRSRKKIKVDSDSDDNDSTFSARKSKKKSQTKQVGEEEKGKRKTSKLGKKAQPDKGGPNAKSIKKGKKGKEKVTLKAGNRKDSTYLTCSNCDLAVKRKQFTLSKHWDAFEGLCAKKHWKKHTHRHFLNYIEDVGFSEKNVKAGVKVASANQRGYHAVGKLPCPKDNCNRTFTTLSKLKIHYKKQHANSTEEKNGVPEKKATSIGSPTEKVKEKEKAKAASGKNATHANKNDVVKSKIYSEDNERMRRGLAPLVPLRKEPFSKICNSLPDRLYRFGIVNGVLSKNASTLSGGERNPSPARRVLALHDCPRVVFQTVVHRNLPPFGVSTFPTGSISLVDIQTDAEEVKYPLPPQITPEPPTTSPEPPWLLKAFHLVKRAQNEHRLNSFLKVDDSQKETTTEIYDGTAETYIEVEKKMKELDGKVSDGFPVFFTNLPAKTASTTA
eukprot:CAMPEP_0184012760 /NCGR_PEP_ID=MMETSP0954-20121128/4620_1 /TAXON_ID=627963 /ORGANISM="Aplanochytrium sp, Strain PBS07" /LENGTH=535 /DNA_ID=CAMNT_0026292841 /DNA_START=158 /DNA_END=1762 /DNA_ORIENTATION=+